MPRFFFHVHDDVVALDEEGQELPPAEATRGQAVKEARQLACHEVLEAHLNLAHRIEVEDSSGSAVATVEFGDAFTLHP